MRNYYNKRYINEAMMECSADLNNETFYQGMSKDEAYDAIEGIIQQISSKYQVKDVKFEDGGRFSDTDRWEITISGNTPFNMVFMTPYEIGEDRQREKYIKSITLKLRCEDDECDYAELSINGIPTFAVNPYDEEPYEIFSEDYDIYIIKDEETATMLNYLQEIFFGGIAEELKKGSYVVDSLSSNFEYRYSKDTSYKYDYEDEPDRFA